MSDEEVVSAASPEKGLNQPLLYMPSDQVNIIETSINDDDFDELGRNTEPSIDYQVQITETNSTTEILLSTSGLNNAK